MHEGRIEDGVHSICGQLKEERMDEFMKQEKRRETRLRKFWRSSKPPTTSSEDSAGGALGAVGDTENESPLKQARIVLQHSSPPCKPTCSLPLLQIWPSQDSPRGEADGQSFIFPVLSDDANNIRRQSQYSDHLHAGDSGIDSVQASPSPIAIPCHPLIISNAVSAHNSPVSSPLNGSPTTSSADRSNRRPSSALLHPDHARIFSLRPPPSPDQSSIEDIGEFNGPHICTTSSSTTSSLTSIAAAGPTLGYPTKRSSDPWLQPESDKERDHDRRRSSTMTARYSLFDALDLEYALLRAAARGSVGPYSLSESLHKLTFTQSLAFPALARGLATKRRRGSAEPSSTRPLNPNESGLNTFAKIVTACVLVMISFLVFLVVYKYVRT